MGLHSRLLGSVVGLAFLAFVVGPEARAAEPVGAAASHRAEAQVEAGVPWAPASTERAVWDGTQSPEVLPVARDTTDLEDHGGYTSEYIFGMTKGVMRSTLTPALKPVVLLLTVPLDIAFLPFAAIGGFFR